MTEIIVSSILSEETERHLQRMRSDLEFRYDREMSLDDTIIRCISMTRAVLGIPY